jgi:hypothetical protein
MITRRYGNSKGQQQEVTLSAEEWEALTEEALNEILGFTKPAEAPAPKPKKKK